MGGNSHDLVARVLRPDVLAMAGYTVQNPAGMLKMDAMENPHLLPDHLQRELGRRLGAVALNRYPGPRVAQLRAALMVFAEVPEAYGLMLGNGSDELISLLALACAVPGASVLAPEPGFVMYGFCARLHGLRYHGVPLQEDFGLDEAAMLAAIARYQPALVYLAFPNNPTANLWDVGVMERVIAAAPGLVVLDEAYQPFAGRSFMRHLGQFPNVLLMRTMSKFGLAGVRIGYLVGPSALIAQVDKVRPPYNISSLNAECALFALEHADEFARQAHDIVSQRGELIDALRALSGVRVYPSDANMVLVRVGDGVPGAAERIFEQMKTRGVLVKNVSNMHPLLDNCLRLTVGTAQQNRAMVLALGESL